jgi:hypothetical protein
MERIHNKVRRMRQSVDSNHPANQQPNVDLRSAECPPAAAIIRQAMELS